MEILELVAEKALGKSVLARHSELKSGLRKIDKNTGTRATSQTSADEKQRIAGIIEDWDDKLAAEDREYRKLRRRDEKRVENFLRKYFSLKHQAGLKTQAEVGKAAGLERTQITVLESGEHMPQQKTLQKLAKAFGVDVTDLM